MWKSEDLFISLRLLIAGVGLGGRGGAGALAVVQDLGRRDGGLGFVDPGELQQRLRLDGFRGLLHTELNRGKERERNGNESETV